MRFLASASGRPALALPGRRRLSRRVAARAVEPTPAAAASRAARRLRAGADRLLPAAAQTLAADPAGGAAASRAAPPASSTGPRPLMKTGSAPRRQRRPRRSGPRTASACRELIAQAEALMARAAHRPQGPLCDQGRAPAWRGRRIACRRRQCARSLARRLLARGDPARPRCCRLDAWVTPPVYTGIAPIVLADGSEKVGAGAESFRALSVPERSELIVRTHAPQGETVSLVTSRDGGRGQDRRAEEGRQRRAGRVQRGARPSRSAPTSRSAARPSPNGAST